MVGSWVDRWHRAIDECLLFAWVVQKKRSMSIEEVTMDAAVKDGQILAQGISDVVVGSCPKIGDLIRGSSRSAKYIRNSSNVVTSLL